MRHRFSSVVILLAASLSISAEAPYIPTDFSGTDPDGLVVHEWGTFTSVAAEDGTAVDWVPQQGPRDLPCFVDRVQYNIKGWLPATVRMETPVLYFYSPDEKAVDVRVRFPQGIITEWYPRAEVAPTRIEADDSQKSRARRHDRVESGQGPAARGRRLSGRERRESLLRGPQDRRVAGRNPN